MTIAKRGPGRPKKINAAEAALATIEATSASDEAYAPAGSKVGEIENTMWLNASASTTAGEKEVFVIKIWDDGTVYYIDPDTLDKIDRVRLTRALRRANKAEVQLWEVLKDTKLSNQKNALEYFHQITRTYKPEGANRSPTAAELTQRVQREESGIIERGGLSGLGSVPDSQL